MQSVKKLGNFREFGKKILCSVWSYKFPGRDPSTYPKEPVICLKPTSSYIEEGQDIKIPGYTNLIDYEVELGLVVGKTGKNILESEAMSHIGGYILALDMTHIEESLRARKAGRPFCVAKGFDTACPVSGLLAKEQILDLHNVDLWLKVNGEMRQEGNTRDLIFSIPYLVSWVSQRFTLEEGDVILTGRPGKPGSVVDGDVIECGMGDIVKMTFAVKK